MQCRVLNDARCLQWLRDRPVVGRRPVHVPVQPPEPAEGGKGIDDGNEPSQHGD